MRRPTQKPDRRRETMDELPMSSVRHRIECTIRLDCRWDGADQNLGTRASTSVVAGRRPTASSETARGTRENVGA